MEMPNYHNATSTGRAMDARIILIPQLRAAVAGRVITPDDADYDGARTVFYGGIDRRPGVIIQAADAADVARVVALARESVVDLAVRSGGHSLAGYSVSDGALTCTSRT